MRWFIPMVTPYFYQPKLISFIFLFILIDFLHHLYMAIYILHVYEFHYLWFPDIDFSYYKVYPFPTLHCVGHSRIHRHRRLWPRLVQLLRSLHFLFECFSFGALSLPLDTLAFGLGQMLPRNADGGGTELAFYGTYHNRNRIKVDGNALRQPWFWNETIPLKKYQQSYMMAIHLNLRLTRNFRFLI